MHKHVKNSENYFPYLQVIRSGGYSISLNLEMPKWLMDLVTVSLVEIQRHFSRVRDNTWSLLLKTDYFYFQSDSDFEKVSFKQQIIYLFSYPCLMSFQSIS